MDKKIVKAAKKAVKAKAKKAANKKIRKLLSDRIPILKPLSGLSDMLGFGRFKELKGSTESAPVAYSRQTEWKASPTRREQRSELIGTVNGSVAFGFTRWAINPAIPGTFPWLSTIAGGYQQYRFNALRFRFETTSPTSSKGQVILIPEYASFDVPPTTEQQACNAQGAISNSCWSSFACNFDPSAMHSTGTRKFLRSGYNAVSGSLCESGAFMLATVGMTDGSAIGRLWVDYDVSLYVPQPPDQFVRTAGRQLLSFRGVDVPSDVGYHSLSQDGVTQNLFLAAPVVNGYPSLMRGIYKISGQINVQFGSGAGTGLFYFRVKLGGVTVFQPYTADQFFSLAIPDPGAGSMKSSLPYSFFVQVDNNGTQLNFEASRGATAAGATLSIMESGSTMIIEPA